jgi:type IX secretion system PorP/SprF family membrane protein
MKKTCVLFVSLIALNLSAQDIHFSQTSQTPLLVNPACAGVYDGWERIILNHRNQWLGSATQFMTSSVAADINVGKNDFKDKAHLGLGFLFYNDIGGDSRFGTQSGALTVSGILPVGGGHTISAGIQSGFGNRVADFTSLTFNSQWNGTAYDPDILTGESSGTTGFKYFDASAGLYYVYDASKSSFRRKDNFKVQLGLGAFHLNRPTLYYVGVSGDKMYSKYVAHAAINADISMTDWSVDGNIVQVFQGPHRETILGAIAKYRFKDGSKITGLAQDAYFGFGSYFRINDAICPTIQLDWRGFRLGISYDATISTMRKAYQGSLEFSLSYTTLNHALFKSRRR